MSEVANVGVLVVYVFSGCTLCLKKYSGNKKERWNKDLMSETVFARAVRHGPGPFYTRSVIGHPEPYI